VRANPDVAPHDLEPLGFGAILDAVHERARSSPVLCLESTGTAGYFGEFLDRLRSAYRVHLVHVRASPDLCLERVRARDGANHIPVSDERLREINRVAATVSLPWDLEVNNADAADQSAAVVAIAGLLNER
jgi:hypothetical protein